MLDINLFFPTAIALEHNETLADQLLPIAKKYLSTTNLNNNNLGYTSTYDADSGLEQCQDFDFFLDYINEKAYEFLGRSGYDTEKISLSAKIFVSEMKFGDSHNSHVHPNCILSGIMYLQVPEGSAPIVFSDARSAKRMLSLPRQQETFINQTETPIFPKPGMMLLWESWLAHSVPVNRSVDGRITVVFNFS